MAISLDIVSGIIIKENFINEVVEKQLNLSFVVEMKIMEPEEMGYVVERNCLHSL
jgi:hypothetical protein